MSMTFAPAASSAESSEPADPVRTLYLLEAAPPPSEPANPAAEGLPGGRGTHAAALHRSCRKDEENHLGNAVVNFTEREIPYTRIIEHKHQHTLLFQHQTVILASTIVCA